MRKSIFGCVGAFAAAFACAPTSALAADVNVDGTVAPGLTLTVATPSAIALFPGQTSTAVADVSVVSTSTSWTLQIKDGGTAYPSGHTPGHMAKLSGTGTCSLLSNFTSTLSELANPMTWNAPVAGTSGTLTGSNATVRNGSLIETIPVTYSQQVGSSEAVSLGDCYRVVVTYTAS